MTVNKIILKVSDLLVVTSDLEGNKWFLVLMKSGINFWEINLCLIYKQLLEKLVKMEICEVYLWF